MIVLIVEDDEVKRDEIRHFVVTLGIEERNVRTAKDMAEFMAEFNDEVMICVVDLRFPAYDGADIERNGIGVIQAIERSKDQVKLLAISAYPTEFDGIRSQFEGRGCMLVDFDQRDVWHNILRQMVIEIQRNEVMDFVIFCALRAERSPYTAIPELAGKAVFKDGLTRFDVNISGRRGTIVELPRMGLVDAAVTAGRCIEKFKPKVIAMSGICAGFAGRAELGQLLVSDLAYEYQSGKWTTDGFAQEPYQAPMSENVRLCVREILEDDSLLSTLEAGWKGSRPSKMSDPKIGMFTSGSAVIASDKYIEQVSGYHRRVSGLDMEVYAVHRASQISLRRPDVLCAKVVVDLADGDKNDLLQPYGCMISARFVVEFLRRYFNDGRQH